MLWTQKGPRLFRISSPGLGLERSPPNLRNGPNLPFIYNEIRFRSEPNEPREPKPTLVGRRKRLPYLSGWHTTERYGGVPEPNEACKRLISRGMWGMKILECSCDRGRVQHPAAERRSRLLSAAVLPFRSAAESSARRPRDRRRPEDSTNTAAMCRNTAPDASRYPR
jgi:hypothetical protein